MDVEWFKRRKRELKVSDQVIADAIGRERSVANRVVNGGVTFDIKFADGMAKALQVDRAEILRRSGILTEKDLSISAQNRKLTLSANAELVHMDDGPSDRARGDLPIYGTALGSARDVEGEGVEQTTLNRADTVLYVKRPSILNGRSDAYGLHVQGSSMHPALPDGELIVASPSLPISIGDNVVVYLRTDNHEDDDGHTARAVLVKELVRRNASYVELRQYSPAMDFRIPQTDVLRIDHVLSRKEMLN